jgi:hypothetical protein
MYMKAMLGISLYTQLYLKLAKILCLSYYLLHFLFNKIGEEGQNRFCLEVRGMKGRRAGGRCGPNYVCTYE